MSLLKKVHIGSLTTENNIFLAPLAGFSDRIYRVLGKKFGAGLTFTEMVSAHGITLRNSTTMNLLVIGKDERPCSIQLFGSNPEIIGTAAALCNEYTADLIDINAGCSVRKVLKSGSGARLLGDPDLVYRIVKSCVNASCYPVSIKMRLGLTEERIAVLENALAAQEAGASLVTLHPRTAEERYGGEARWEYIGFVKQSLKIPVCGNGDIRTPGDAVKMVEETGCDAVMIGRAAIGNPWIVKDIMRAFESYPEKPQEVPLTKEERVRCALEHLAMSVRFKGEVRGIREVKRQLHRYLRDMSHVSKVRESLFRIETKEEAVGLLQKLLCK